MFSHSNFCKLFFLPLYVQHDTSTFPFEKNNCTTFKVFINVGWKTRNVRIGHKRCVPSSSIQTLLEMRMNSEQNDRLKENQVFLRTTNVNPTFYKDFWLLSMTFDVFRDIALKVSSCMTFLLSTVFPTVFCEESFLLTLFCHYISHSPPRINSLSKVKNKICGLY